MAVYDPIALPNGIRYILNMDGSAVSDIDELISGRTCARLQRSFAFAVSMCSCVKGMSIQQYRNGAFMTRLNDVRIHKNTLNDVSIDTCSEYLRLGARNGVLVLETGDVTVNLFDPCKLELVFKTQSLFVDDEEFRICNERSDLWLEPSPTTVCHPA